MSHELDLLLHIVKVGDFYMVSSKEAFATVKDAEKWLANHLMRKDQVYMAIEDGLEHATLLRWGHSLKDHLTPDGETVDEGKKEIKNIIDQIAYELGD